MTAMDLVTLAQQQPTVPGTGNVRDWILNNIVPLLLLTVALLLLWLGGGKGDNAGVMRRLGGVLDTLGISSDGRVGTFAWNSARHLELYYAVPLVGAVLHTINVRLFPEQIAYVTNHAADKVVFFDAEVADRLAEAFTELLGGRLDVLIEALHLLVRDPEGAAVMGKAARRAALTRYGLERFLADWDALLEEVRTR